MARTSNSVPFAQPKKLVTLLTQYN